MQLLRWLLHRRIRKASELLSVVRRHYLHQKDILPEKNRSLLEAGMRDFKAAIENPGTSADGLKKASADFEQLAHAWLKPYAHATYRDNFESFLGTAVLVFAFKTFFATPMEIPTGSAQPTYYGITSEDLRERPDVKIPTGLGRLWERWIKGVSYYEVIAEEDGEYRGLANERKQFRFGGKAGMGSHVDILVGNRAYPVNWAPERPGQFFHLDAAGIYPVTKRKASFKKGEPIVRCRVRAGDRLFVERLTYNFRPPRRGEYFVFQSQGVGPQYGVVQGTHYIKRLVAFGGEQVRIKDDRHVHVNGRALGTNDPGFEKIYAFDPNGMPADSVYSGHVNGTQFRKALEHHLMAAYAPGNDVAAVRSWIESGLAAMRDVTRFFPDEQTEQTVPPGMLLGLGDNTMSSSDGRSWGYVPREKVIGKGWFVMWPFTERWGW